LEDRKKHIIRRDIKIVIVFIVFICILFNVPNYIRYEVTNLFTESKVTFSEPSLGLLNIEYGEYDLISDPVSGDFNIDLTGIDFEHEYYIFGNYYNSNKTVTVMLNEEIIFNGKPKTEFSNVFKNNYLEKKYVIRLGKINKNSEIEILIGKEKFKYNIYLN